MAFPVKSCLLCFLVYFIFMAIYFILSHFVSLSKESRTLLLRARFAVSDEFALIVGIWITWTRLKCLFQFDHWHCLANADDKLKLKGHGHDSGKDGLYRWNRIMWKHSIMKLLIYIFLGLTQLSFFNNLFFQQTDPHWFAFASYICLGILMQFIFCLVVLWFLQLLGKAAIKIHLRVRWTLTFKRQDYKILPDSEMSTWKNEKDLEVQNTQIIIAICYSILIAIYGTYRASQPPSIQYIEVSIPGLPSSMDNLKIIQISDIHLGPTVGRKKLEIVVEIINSLNADAVVLVGDLADGSVQQLGGAAEVLKYTQAKFGNYFVIGNHDYYTGDVDNWFKFLKGHGFTVLHNEHVKIEHDQDKFFYLAGVDDPTANVIRYDGHGMELAKSLGDCAKDKPIVLLAHQPKVARAALDSDYNIKLALAGHTHGGQMFPLTLVAYLTNPFFAGLYKYKEGYVYVSTGTVYWGIPMRIGSTMEVTHILLKAA